MQKTLLAACILATGLGYSTARAETLQMADTPAAQTRTVAPNRGMSMAQVESHFGSPSEKVAPVGRPPITRWVYPGFIVYFEGHQVIHAVTTSASK